MIRLFLDDWTIIRKFTIVILLTLAAGGTVYREDTTIPLENRLFFQFPLTFDRWTGQDIPMSEYVYRGIETPYLFMRNYSSLGDPIQVNLALVWFDDTNVAFHTPEACLGGLGDKVLKKSKVGVQLGGRDVEVVQDLVEIGATRFLVFYFFDVDGSITTSQIGIRLHVLKKRLSFERASASFIRIMAPITNDERQTNKILTEFLLAMYPLLPAYTHTEQIQSLK